MTDHVHLLIEVDPQLGVRKGVKLIKGRSPRISRSNSVLDFRQRGMRLRNSARDLTACLGFSTGEIRATGCPGRAITISSPDST